MFLMAQKTLATKGHLTKLPSFMFRSVYFSNLKQVCRSSGKYLAASLLEQSLAIPVVQQQLPWPKP